MRLIAIFAGALLLGGAQPAMAQCMGKYPNQICVYEDGVWTPAGFIPFANKSSGPSKYPNATSTGSSSAPASDPPASGETVVMTPSAETGNAWVLEPQSGGGATCGQGTRCD